MDWLSLLLPILYLAVLIGSLGTFSHLYRARKAAKAASLEAWFPRHLQRDVYLSLLEYQAKPDTKVPDSLLRAALFRRATEDIHRLISIRNSKPALSQLLQRGAVGDELWQRFLVAEKEIDLELRDVVNEANALAPQQNWGQTIFQSAGEAAHNEILRRKIAEIEERRQDEKNDWEKRRENVREGFMKELEDGDETKDSPKKPGSSDDDAVLVEADGTPSRGTGGGGKKKNKNKK